MFKISRKEFIIIFFIITNLIVVTYFSTSGPFQQVVATIIFFVILPLLFNKFFLKVSIKELGLTIGDYRQGIKFGVISLIIIFFIFGGYSYYFGFLEKYTVPAFIVDNFGAFMLYELALVIPVVYIYEFYFRGFLMAVFSKKMGPWVILMQACIFFALALLDRENKLIQLVPYLVVAPFAGLIAYKSKSFFYSGIVQFIVVIVLNVIIIKRIG